MGVETLGFSVTNELHTYTTIMPNSRIFISDIFSVSYKLGPISDRPNVTNVVRKRVKKLSVGQ